MPVHVDIVFDAPPGPENARFIEVEDVSGRSIPFGQWLQRDDGRWVLRIVPEDFAGVGSLDVREVQAALDRAAEKVRREGPGDGRFSEEATRKSRD
jgi:hypothetical protein